MISERRPGFRREGEGVRAVLGGTISGQTWTTRTKYVWEGDSYYDPLVITMVGGA
jgi:hypothetical protein